MAEGENTIPLGADGSELIVNKSAASRLSLRVIRSQHAVPNSNPVNLRFDEESDGTKRLAHLVPAIYQARDRCQVYVIDEVDRSLHPLLSRKFLTCFLNSCGRQHSQLLVTTHESNLMDLEILRRDELWFAEKDPGQATSLYSLADFQVRKDLKIDRGYLEGRFGAIPFLGNLDKLCGAC